METVQYDVAVFGGGVAGLWIAHQLTHHGYSVAVLEKNALGAGQTIASQGILHGGAKYLRDAQGLQGARSLGHLPERWVAHIEKAELPALDGVKLLAPYQHFIFNGWLCRVAVGGVIQYKLTKAVSPVPKKLWPSGLQDVSSCVSLLRLHEPIIDAGTLMETFKAKLGPRLGHYTELLERKANADSEEMTVLSADGRKIQITARLVFFCSGAGNEAFGEGVLPQKPRRRPLQQIMIKGAPFPLYGHWMGFNEKPRATITSHQLPTGEWVWYLGGQVAEDSVGLDPAAAIQLAVPRMKELFPRLDFSKTQWATWKVDRAEPQSEGGAVNLSSRIERVGRRLFCWPQKLVLGPKLADDALALVQSEIPQKSPLPEGFAFTPPAVAKLPWEAADWVSLNDLR